MKKVGPIEFLHGDKSPTGTTFRISTLGREHEVVIDRDGDTITGRWKTDDEAGRVPVFFSATGSNEVHGLLTLPHPTDVGWTSQPTTLSELTLAAGGDVAKWLNGIGAAVSECNGHPCLQFPDTMLGAAVVAVAATRIRPVMTEHPFGNDPPWVIPPSVGAVSSASSKGGGGASSETVVGKMELYPKLVDAVADAARVAGPCVEYGIVEHHFAYANVDDYRELHGMYGHLAVDHPMKWSMSGYLAMLVGRLSENDEIVHRTTKGTGYWRYNSDISAWSLPGASDVAVTSWGEFASSTLGRHPAEWPAAALLWGEEPVVSRSWSGHVGPGESAPGLRLQDLPTTSTDTGVRVLALSFDAPSRLRHGPQHCRRPRAEAPRRRPRTTSRSRHASRRPLGRTPERHARQCVRGRDPSPDAGHVLNRPSGQLRASSRSVSHRPGRLSTRSFGGTCGR